jgi:tetratricopeptide (TPR) repeat protein
LESLDLSAAARADRRGRSRRLGRARRAALGTVAAVLSLTIPASADRVLTVDGRILTPQKARVEGAGYRLTFAHGTILLPDASLVASAEIEGDMSDYVPANDDERQKLAQGYVKYRGRWMSRPGYEDELRKQTETSKKRTADLALHSDWSNAWEKETAHFRLRSNTSPEILDDYAELMEAFYSLMDDRIGIDPSPSLKRSKMDVRVYKSHEEFLALAQPNKPTVLGFFSPMEKSLNFYHDYAEPSRSEWVALHESTHLLTFLIDPQYLPQIWLNEAVADYFGSSRIYRDKKGKLCIQPGELQMDRTLTVQQALRNASPATGEKQPTAHAPAPSSARPFTRLEDLFLLTREQFDGFQYAHAWSFVYFLNNGENGKYRKSFDKFFKGLYTLEKGIPSTVENVGGAVREMGGVGKLVAPADIRAYLLQKLKVSDASVLERQWRDFVAAIPIEGAAARLKRGMLALREMRFEDALLDLNTAIEGGTTDPRAWAARARAYAMTLDFGKALVDYRAAIERNPLSAGYRYEYSRVLAGRSPWIRPAATGSSGASLDADSDTEKISNADARAQAGLASELDPENDRFRLWYERFE